MRKRISVAALGCGVGLVGAVQAPVGAAAAASSAQSTRHIRGAVLFYDPHPANGGKAGYVLLVRLRRPLPTGQHIIGRVGGNFPVTTLDKRHTCYSGGVRGFGSTTRVRYGGTYRVRLWIGAQPDPDHAAPAVTFDAHLRHADTGKTRARTQLGCADPNGYLS